MSEVNSNRPWLRSAAAVAATLAVAGCSLTPEALAPEAVRTAAADAVAVIEQEPEPIAGPVGLEEAIARAVKYNRDKRLRVMEAALAQRQLDLAGFDMLPDLTASAGYSERDNLAASASGTLVNGSIQRTTPPTFSVSQDKRRHTAGVAFTWNILDFGLSYVRAGQQADRYLIAKERERKVVHNIIQEVRAAYWRAVSAERLLTRIAPLMARVEAALADSRSIEAMRLRAPLDALGYQRELLDILRSLQALQRDLVNAKTELAALMAVRPGRDFALADTTGEGFAAPTLALDLATMERTALVQRPELMESRYQERISREEVRAALLGMLPGITLDAGVSYDSNDFLLNNSWTSYGAAVGWNLLDVFRGMSVKRLAEAQTALAREQSLALSMAVLSQVHLANLRFHQARKEYATAGRYLDVARRISGQMRASAEAQRSGELQMIREELNGVLAELRRDVAHAEMQNSFGQIFASMGLDPLPETMADDSIPALAQAVRERFEVWRAGGGALVERPADLSGDLPGDRARSDAARAEAERGGRAAGGFGAAYALRAAE